MPEEQTALTVVVRDGVEAQKAEQYVEYVRLQIVQIGQQIHRSFVRLGRLLKEARDNEYHLAWGFARFGAWVEEDSGLDISERTAYDFIRIIEMAEKLGVPDDELEAIKISNLKEIASLPDDTDPEMVKGLLEEAKTMPLKSVRAVVGTMKSQDWVYHTHKFLRETEESVYQPAVEKIRRMYGNTINPDGNPDDISESRCVELAMAEVLAQPEAEELPIIEAEFNDVIASAEEAESDQTTA